MPTPTEHKTVQSRILKYAQAIGWTFVPRREAEQRRGFNSDASPKERAKNRSLFFPGLLNAKVREFNLRYAETALLGKFHHLPATIYGNQKIVEYLRNRGTYSDHKEKRERDLLLIDYDNPARNVYEVTEEFAFHNGRHGTREDVVFLIFCGRVWLSTIFIYVRVKKFFVLAKANAVFLVAPVLVCNAHENIVYDGSTCKGIANLYSRNYFYRR